MATASKGSHVMKNLVIALLTLWSIISLIIIIVWATSPSMKSSDQCRVELREATEKLEGAKVVHQKDRVALEEKVEEGRVEQGRLRGEIRVLLARLNATNTTLQECRQEKVVLNMNISGLQEDVRRLQQREANLTGELQLQEEQMDSMRQNLTQALLQTESCFNLKLAAESQMLAAQTQTKACESNQAYLQKQLQKCKVESEAPQQKQESGSSSSLPTSKPHSTTAPLAAIPGLILLFSAALHLITCECQRF